MGAAHLRPVLEVLSYATVGFSQPTGQRTQRLVRSQGFNSTFFFLVSIVRHYIVESIVEM
jgi:hypothetical protein